MKDEPPSTRSDPGAPAARLLRLAVRARETLGRSTDRVLSADRAWSVVFVAVVLALVADLGGSLQGVRPGQPAPEDVVAPRDLQLVDPEETARRRAEARATVPDVYVYDRTRGEHLARELADRIAVLRRGGTVPGLPAEARTALRQTGASAALERELVTAVHHAQSGRVVANRALLVHQPAVLLREIPEAGEEQRVTDYSGFLPIGDAQAIARQQVLDGVPPGTPGRTALAELAASFVDANVTHDAAGTEVRRARAAAAVQPVRRLVPRGTRLVASGEPVPADVMAELRRGRLTGPGLVPLLGLATVVGLLAFFVYRYTRYHQRHYTKIRHLHALFVILMVSLLLLSEAVQWVAHGLSDELRPPFDRVELYLYLFPVGAGAIVVALLANGRIAMVFSAFTALLFGMLADWDMFRMTWVLLVQWAGVYAIATYRDRAALLRAGLVVGGVGAALVLALHGLRGGTTPGTVVAWGAGLAFVGGAVGVGLLVSFVLPVLERLFGALTDVRLLELSDVNHPLLTELARRAPGSWTHSLAVGALAEEAARAIEANPLFCRVAALYHDVGKLKKPEYYVENQRAGNPHDRLAPSMSALVIAAHVKDGIRLARDAGIPEQIVDIVPQHHGTRLMTYFYEKARRLAGPGGAPPNEEDFRYPGPKPQTREAAIFMLADGVEAAARTAEDANPGRMREVIRQVTNAIVLDGQLDECDLTFADLDRVQNAMHRTLVSSRHHRVDYPGFDFNRRRTDRGNEARPEPADPAPAARTR